MIVEFTPEANADLETISDFIAKDDPTRALSFTLDVRDRCARLSDFPERFPLPPRFEQRQVRHLSYKKYLIFYRIDPGVVIILRILHGARDYQAILFPD